MNESSKLTLGIMGVTMAAACFLAGYLLLTPAKEHEAAPLPVTSVADTATPTPAPATGERPRLYNITIETNADWSRAILANATFVTGAPGMGYNDVEMTSDAPQQVGRFTYAPTEVAINQKQFATAAIVVKGVVATSDRVLQVKLGHGDNGSITIRSPADAFTNDRVTGDGENFVSGVLNLE
jgi:hypothetical protein